LTPATVRLCFLIRQLNEGGAQRQLVELVKGLDPSRYSTTIITFYSGGRFSAEVAQLPHVTHLSMGKHRRWEVFHFAWRLVSAVRQLRPNILHGYLPASNVLSIALKPFLPGTRIVWGFRASNLDWTQYDWFDRLLFRLQRALAGFADLIIANSEAGKDYHVAHGFPANKIVVIPNGIDTHVFVPNQDARSRTRAEWGVTDDEKLIGVVGRLHPMKDHPTFIRAAALAMQTHGAFRFVCIGDGRPDYRRELMELGNQLGLADRIIWKGWQADMPSVQNALDIATLCSSNGEGFPNAVGEAMACGVPCVVTDVGDSPILVGETGVVVPLRDPQALADGWNLMLTRLATEGRELRSKARCRIVQEFDRDRLAATTSQVLGSLL